MRKHYAGRLKTSTSSCRRRRPCRLSSSREVNCLFGLKWISEFSGVPISKKISFFFEFMKLCKTAQLTMMLPVFSWLYNSLRSLWRQRNRFFRRPIHRSTLDRVLICILLYFFSASVLGFCKGVINHGWIGYPESPSGLKKNI